MPQMILDIPEKLDQRLDQIIKNGWAGSKQEILNEALKRYLDSHKDEIIEEQILSDVEWGLSH
jgi:metal-responsive CopG/Arc/MetJ family transcriptional regulator